MKEQNLSCTEDTVDAPKQGVAKPKIYIADDRDADQFMMPFGRWKFRTVRWISQNQPLYFRWLAEQDGLSDRLHTAIAQAFVHIKEKKKRSASQRQTLPRKATHPNAVIANDNNPDIVSVIGRN